MRLRVLFINRSYWPDTEATGQLLTQLCTCLAGEFEVEVIAGMPNYTDKAATHSHAGVTIHRVGHTKFSKFSAIGKMVNLLTFTWAAFLKARKLRPDIVVTETDPFLLPLIGQWMKRRQCCKFIAYLQDIYPDVAVAVGAIREGILTRTIRRFLVRAYNNADKVIVLSEDMKKRCINNGVVPEKLEIIHNWADCEKIKPVTGENAFRKGHNLENKFVVMYSGNHGRVHLLVPVIEACILLKDDASIKFVFIGEGAQKKKLQRIATAANLNNIVFLTYEPQESLSCSLGAADVHILSLAASAVNCVMPSKLYGVLAAGRALLAVVPANCDLAETIRRHDVGTICNSHSPRLPLEIAEELLRMNADREKTRSYGIRARSVCLREFDRPIAVGRIAKVLVAASECESRSLS